MGIGWVWGLLTRKYGIRVEKSYHSLFFYCSRLLTYLAPSRDGEDPGCSMDIRVHFAVRTTPPPDSTVDASVGARKRKRGESIACLDARCTAPCGDRLARTFGLVDTSVCPAIAPVGASDPLAALRRAHPGVPFRATPSGTTQVLRRGRGKSKKKWHRCCRRCKKAPNYNDEEGRPKRLCAAHAHAAGTYAVQKPCRDCPDDAKLQAAYNDEDDQPNRLCATHARAVGTYAVQHPCRDCPDDAKLEAGYNDEDDRPSRLCAAHARAAEEQLTPLHVRPLRVRRRDGGAHARRRPRGQAARRAAARAGRLLRARCALQ